MHLPVDVLATRRIVEHGVGGFLVVGGDGFVDVHEHLGIAVHEGEPGALELHHDAVALLEGVEDVVHGPGHAGGLAGGEGRGVFEAVAELAAHDLAAHQLLVAAHGIGPVVAT